MKNNVIKYSKLEEVSTQVRIHVGADLYPLNPMRCMDRLKLTPLGVSEFLRLNKKFKFPADIFTVSGDREIPRLTYCTQSGDMLVRNFLIGGIHDIPRTALGILKRFGRKGEIAFLTTYSKGNNRVRYQLFIVE